MKSKTIIIRGFQIVAVIFAGFNGFITNWGPPIDAFSETSFEVGFTSFLALIILLIIVSVSKYYPNLVNKKGWISISIVFFVATIIIGTTYRSQIQKFVIVYPPNSIVIIGNELTEDAQKYFDDHKITGNIRMLEDFGPNEIDRIWTIKSINRVTKIISTLYIFFVLSICISIFCITEGVLVNNKL